MTLNSGAKFNVTRVDGMEQEISDYEKGGSRICWHNKVFKRQGHNNRHRGNKWTEKVAGMIRHCESNKVMHRIFDLKFCEEGLREIRELIYVQDTKEQIVPEGTTILPEYSRGV